MKLTDHQPVDWRLAYAAGLFEGEGTVGAYWVNRTWTNAAGEKKPYRQCRIAARIVMTDPEPLHVFRDYVKLGKVLGPYIRTNRIKEKPYYVWQIHSAEEVRQLFEKLSQFLADRRRMQFVSALETVQVDPHWAGEGE